MVTKMMRDAERRNKKKSKIENIKELANQIAEIEAENNKKGKKSQLYKEKT